mmetsp:Transcript_17049/g.39405  ORF Transcript_17049/g.39405 Transcript_17049/m.39405 type:complete len:128 (+) Transcript_17049:3323-3706(+)
MQPTQPISTRMAATRVKNAFANHRYQRSIVFTWPWWDTGRETGNHWVRSIASQKGRPDSASMHQNMSRCALDRVCTRFLRDPEPGIPARSHTTFIGSRKQRINDRSEEHPKAVHLRQQREPELIESN